MGGIIWACAAWGKKVDVFVRHHVPSMLLPGNLSALREFGPVELVLYTNLRDINLLLGAVNTLERAGVVVTMPDIYVDNLRSNHETLVLLQRDAVARAIRQEAGLAFTYADVIMPEMQYASLGSPSSVYDGDIGCFVSSGGVPASAEHWLFQDGFAATRSLHSVQSFHHNILEASHEMAELWTVGPDGPCTGWPARLIWRDSKGGVVIHALNQEPILCWPRKTSETWTQALDINFVETTKFAGKRIEHASTFTLAELCPTGLAGGITKTLPVRPNQIARWAASNVPMMNIMLFAYQCRFGVSETNHWAAQAAGQIVLRAIQMAKDGDRVAPGPITHDE